MPESCQFVLVNEFWAQLHRLWGLSKTGLYDKQGWASFQLTAETLFEGAGLERRQAGRSVARAMEVEGKR